MSEKSSSVEIVLENCEFYRFDAKDVDILLDGIGRHFWGGFCDLTTVERCTIIIDKGAKPTNKLEDWQDENWAKRIHKDITQVSVNGATYHVYWGDGEWENEYEYDIDEGDRMVYKIGKNIE